MRIFSRITFIFNIGFLIALVLQATDASALPAGAMDGAVLNPLVIFILTLYFLSGLVNFIFFLFALYFLTSGKPHSVPRWILYVNLVILIIQLFYFFIF